MEETDYLDLNGRQLQILLTIHEAGSLSKAAKMLDMNQSTISYWLDILRKRIGDPLFVRAGNGVQATDRALVLIPKVREALRHLQLLSESDTYDPSNDNGTLRLAGSALEREMIFSELIRFSLEAAPSINFEISSAGSAFQAVERLRQGSIDFALIPSHVVDADGIVCRTVLRFIDAVYYDAGHPLKAGDIDAYCERPQARVAFGPDAGFGIDRKLAKLGKSRRIALQVGDFDSAMRLIRGTPLIATLPACLDPHRVDDISNMPPPWEQTPKSVALHWHARNQDSARHAFWRDRIAEIGRQHQ